MWWSTRLVLDADSPGKSAEPQGLQVLSEDLGPPTTKWGNTMSGTFRGVTVLELTWGIAGPMIGMMLVDQGAEVIRLEIPGDPFGDTPGYHVWNRGKQSAEIDLKSQSGRNAFLKLAAKADVVVDSFRPGTMERLGIDPASLRKTNHRLITCSLTAYGTGNEHSGRPGYEALVAARSGSQWAQRGGILSSADLGMPEVEIPAGAEQAARPEGPIFSASPWMSMNGFYHATLGIGAALVARERTGLGQHVETSMLARTSIAEAISKDNTSGGAGGGATRGSWMNLRGAPRGLFECKDGRWVHQWPLKPLRVVEAAEHDRLEDSPKPDFARRADPARIGLEPEAIVELFYWLPLLQAAFKKFSADEWVAWGDRIKEGVQPVRSPEEALADPLLLEDGSIVEVEDPELGRIRHIGLITEYSRTPGSVRGPAPYRGEHTAEILARAEGTAEPESSAGTMKVALGRRESLEQSLRRTVVANSRSRRGPLSGIRVLDLGLALAGPYGCSLMADLGADVIKVNAPWDGPWMETGIGRMANAGKRSAVIDLRDPKGLEAVYLLVATCDVVSHNMRWGVAERIGIGYDELVKHNPSLIYCETRGFDLVRSASNVPGTDQSGSALAGQEWEDGGASRGGKPFFGTSMGDLGNGFLAAIATVNALFHRERTGEGQRVGTSILNACLATSSYTFITADGIGAERPRLDGMQLGFSALYRLYETSDGWLCLAAIQPDHWEKLISVLGADHLGDDPRFSTVEDRAINDEALSAALSATLMSRGASQWFEMLDKAGVPVEISSPCFDSPSLGQPFLRFSQTPTTAPGPPPELGADTEEVLAQIGMSVEEIAALDENSVTAR
jgi:crotonobetainyl-CoA:carnitine CoA-transferase CaiB-like acyl-CoA transferase